MFQKIIVIILSISLVCAGCVTMDQGDLARKNSIDPDKIEATWYTKKTESLGNHILFRLSDMTQNKRGQDTLHGIVIATAYVPLYLVLVFLGPFGLKVRTEGYRFKLRPEYEQKVREVARSVVPSVMVKVWLTLTKNDQIDLVMAGHLLEGDSPYDSNPVVRGDYGSRDRLTAKSKERSAELIKALLGELALQQLYKDIDAIAIQVRHGVKVETRRQGFSFPTSSRNESRKIFAVRAPLEQLRKENGQFDQENVSQVLGVVYNDIPNLHFKSSRSFW
ncbi:MAG: hypothetical protein ACLFPX_03235 [Candidatus Omnitrophota bacterium]